MRALFRARDVPCCRARELSGLTIGRVLVCRPNHRLGNLLLLTPLIQEIGRLLPGAKVDVLAAGDAAPALFAAFDNVDRVYRLSRRVVRHPLQTAAIALRIRRAHYDLAIDPCEASQSSRLFVRLAHADHSIGITREAPVPADGALDVPPHHMAQLPVWLLRQAVLGPARGDARDCPELCIVLSAAERARARQTVARLLPANGAHARRVLIGVFAEATGGKKYPRDWWRQFVDALRATRPDCGVLEILPPDGGQRLAMRLPTFSSPDPRAVAAVISCLTCFICADCGVMHLASASGTPTLGLFSESDPGKYRPYGHGGIAVATLGKGPDEVAGLAQAWFRDVLGLPPEATRSGSVPGAPVPQSRHGTAGGSGALPASASP